jgi:EAL domain-containing protein (putative c-di-GMP-specific phosphodiesterase class I)
MAERLGLIGRLGGQMLRRAYRDVQPWATDDGLPMYVNVNVSAHQLAEPTFTESLLASLLTADFDPSRLVVELTESAFVDHEVEVIRILTRLRAEGIKIAMDDFGTGYSSLASLRSLPLDVLKIDRSFINDLEHRPSDVSFVEAIVGLAHTLGLVVVAEGVETEEQRAILLAAGCDRGQGWLFGKPVAAEDFYTLQLAEVPAA